MAVKQTGRKQYKSMQGKPVDMDLLRQRNDWIFNRPPYAIFGVIPNYGKLSGSFIFGGLFVVKYG